MVQTWAGKGNLLFWSLLGAKNLTSGQNETLKLGIIHYGAEGNFQISVVVFIFNNVFILLFPGGSHQIEALIMQV